MYPGMDFQRVEYSWAHPAQLICWNVRTLSLLLTFYCSHPLADKLHSADFQNEDGQSSYRRYPRFMYGPHVRVLSTTCRALELKSFLWLCHAFQKNTFWTWAHVEIQLQSLHQWVTMVGQNSRGLGPGRMVWISNAFVLCVKVITDRWKEANVFVSWICSFSSCAQES